MSASRCAARLAAPLAGAALAANGAAAQSVSVDFDTAPPHAPLPFDLTQVILTAHFSATGQGFSIQSASTLGFTPAGFAGYSLDPNSVFASKRV